MECCRVWDLGGVVARNDAETEIECPAVPPAQDVHSAPKVAEFVRGKVQRRRQGGEEAGSRGRRRGGREDREQGLIVSCERGGVAYLRIVRHRPFTWGTSSGGNL